jgi:hypothetical protein
MSFGRIARIDLPRHAVFCAVPQTDAPTTTVFYRSHYQSRTLEPAALDLRTFTLAPASGVPTFKGEDPRVFAYRGRTFFTDNFINDTHFIEPASGKLYKVPIAGKNLTVMVNDNDLFIVQWFAPLRVFKCVDFETQSYAVVHSDSAFSDQTLRGGTPGVYDTHTRTFWGMGHRTWTEPCGRLRHTPFRWEIDPETWLAHFVRFDDRPWSRAIVDPTSLIFRDDGWFVVTAESDVSWFSDQDYDTCVYAFSP